MTEIPASKPPTVEELAFGLPSQAEQEQTAKVAPIVRWLTDKKRIESYTLKFPFELDGVEYRTITIKRLTAKEVEIFLDKMRSAGGEKLHLPIYFSEDNAEISDVVWDGVDDDDRFALTEIGASFLPARFRPAMDSPPSKSDPAASGTTGSSSVE